MLTALALVCGALAFTGCNDFEQDINSINDRLDELTTGQIAGMEEQLQSLKDAVDAANGLIDGLSGDVDALESAKNTIEDQIGVLNGAIEDLSGEITGLNGQITDLETALEKQINDAVAELKGADKANAARIDGLVSDLAEAKQELADAIAEGDNANSEKIAALSEKVDSLYDELKKEIDAANTSNKAEFDKIYGELESLKEDLKKQTDALAELISTVTGLSGKVAALEALTENLPELEETVAYIEENYLSKQEAADLYATAESVLALEDKLGEMDARLKTIENLDIAERLSELEANYENLNDIVIPGLSDAIQDAQSAADRAQTSADAALEYATGVYGELQSLKNALGVYAAGIDSRLNELNAMDQDLSDRADALQEMISELNAFTVAEILGLKSNIVAVQANIDAAVNELNETKLSKADFADYFRNELMADIAKADGMINTAISEKLSEATAELQAGIDAVTKRIDEQIMPAINDLSVRMGEIEDAVEDLENRIQSLVYVPEYNDGKAPVYMYTIGGKSVSDRVVAKATFKVTPAALADYVVNQYRENLLVEAVPVKPADTRSAEAPILIFGDDLTVTKGAAPGYIDVEADLYTFEVAGNDIAFSLYVASSDEINQAEAEGTVDMDAGTYVSSEYVHGELVEVKIDDAYVLFNGEKEISEDELNRDMAWADEDRMVDFYEGFTLHIKVGDSYFTLADAAGMMRVAEETITPVYSNEFRYLDASGAEDESLEEYFTVSTAEPYGPVVDMAKEGAEMREKVGSEVVSDNVFTLTLGDAEYAVVENSTVYRVVNKPVAVTVEAQTIPWTYGKALELADNSENPTTPNAKPIFLEAIPYTADFAGYDFNDLLMKQPVTDEVKLNGEPNDGISLVLIDATDETVNAYITGYEFSQTEDNVYDFTYSYKIDETAKCDVSFRLVLGRMPGDAEISYGAVETEFFTGGARYYDLDGDAYTKAWEATQDIPEWFADADEFNASLKLNSTITETSSKDGAGINAEYTHLRLDAEGTFAEGTHIRMSSSDIDAVGNAFEFTTTLETWYGVTYTYTASTETPAPDYRLAYDSANVFEDGSVHLRYEQSNGIYSLQRVDLSDYLHVIGDGLAGLPEDELKVRFESLTATDPEAGYANIPDLSRVLGVDEQNGTLESGWNLDWTSYTARDLQIRAYLMAGDDNIVVNHIDLNIVVDPIITGFAADDDPVNVTRKAGNDARYKLWEYLNAESMFSNGENIIPEANAQGVPHESIEWVNRNSAMKLYGAEIKFDENILGAVADNGGTLIGSYTYNPDEGTLVYYGNNGVIASPVTFTIGATLTYYLDYNGKIMDEPQGAYRVELNIRVSEAE